MRTELPRSHEPIGRRQLLRIGGLGTLGLTLPGLLRAEGLAAKGSGAGGVAVRPARTIKSCILVFFYGGPSHLDTWDYKPNAPREVRGEFGSIASSVPGIRVGEHMPRLSKVVDRLAIIRSMHHPMTNHNAAAFAALSGRNPLKGDLELLGNDRNDPPCLGSTLSAILPEVRGLPTFVALPHVMYNVVQLPGQVPGFLGSAHGPFQVDADPNAPNFRMGELELPGDMTADRLDHRASLLGVLDGQLRVQEQAAEAIVREKAHAGIWDGGASRHPGVLSRDIYNEKAFRLLHSQAVREAFHLDEEDPKRRARYGRTKLGQSMVLARRLVEAGVRFVTVYDGQHNGQLANWDSHSDNFLRLKNDLLPPADRAFATLIEDLDSRGLLEETLVIGLGEFGRTPKVNASAGRDHWPFCYSVVMAGGGVRGGSIHGSSDKIGAYPETDAVTPADLSATLYWKFGIDPEREMRDLTDRPYKLSDGQPIQALFG